MYNEMGNRPTIDRLVSLLKACYMEAILAHTSVGTSELKANPTAVFDAAEGMPVAVLNRNKPVAYIIPAKVWEAICDRLDDIELRQLAEIRLTDGKKSVRVSLDDL